MLKNHKRLLNREEKALASYLMEALLVIPIVLSLGQCHVELRNIVPYRISGANKR